jgi:hypothetical protein
MATQPAIHVLTSRGDRVLTVPDTRERSLASQHSHALRRYERGDDLTGAGLRQFRDRWIGIHRLVDDRDLDLIDEFIFRGDRDWVDFYERR